MKKNIMILISIIAMAFVFTCADTISAGEKATKNECIAKVKEAANMIEEKGLHATKQAINDKNGSFVWKDVHLFMLDDVGILLAHPKRPVFFNVELK